MTLSRRDMLKTTAAAVAATWATGLSPLQAGSTASGNKLPIGLQLYSVRGECAKDLPGTIEKVAKMGYQAVEFAGFFENKAEDLRKMLDDNGIVCCGTHTPVSDLQDDKFKATVEFHQTLGCPFIIIPWLSEDLHSSVETMKKTSDWFNTLVEKIKPYEGVSIGYHSHGYDFTKVDGKTIWDWFFENTSKDFVMQLDIGNCLSGGGDPYAVFKKYPGQMKTIHLKEHGGKPGAPVGEGEVDWKKVFELCKTVGGTKWYVVEHESSEEPMVAVKQCLDNLRNMGF